MTEPRCAGCGKPVAPDSDHTRVTVEKRRMNDRNDEKTYYLHDDCAREETGEWVLPA